MAYCEGEIECYYAYLLEFDSLFICVGILHNMLVRAVYSALWTGEKALNMKHLTQCAPSKSACQEMMREINAGEEELSFERTHTKWTMNWNENCNSWKNKD